MKVYFIRHGQSENNAKGLYQDHSSKLSSRGREQAEILASRLEKLKFDRIISSPYSRAYETAEIIARKHKRQFEVIEMFRERKRPSELENKHWEDKDVNKIMDEIDDNFHNHQWRHSDEENYLDLLRRADSAIDYINKLNKDVLIVSHRTFITFMVSRMIFGKTLTSKTFLTFRLGSKMSNTGITVCEMDNNKWRLTNWNDDAHLG